MPYWTDCHEYWIGKSVAFNGLRRHFIYQTRNDSLDSVVMDEGNSRRVLSFCKPIIYNCRHFREGMKAVFTTIVSVTLQFAEGSVC
jgi:hypothetical protein